MARVIYGAEVFAAGRNGINFNYDIIGKNSEVMTVGDPLKYASGVLAVAGTTDSIAGIAVKTATMASDNQTVAKVAPGYIPTEEDTQFLMGTNSDLTGNATDVGTYYKLTTGTSGAVQVDVTSGVQTTTARVVMIKQVDPFNEGGTGAGSGLRQCVVVFVRKPTWIDQ